MYFNIGAGILEKGEH